MDEHENKTAGFNSISKPQVENLSNETNNQQNIDSLEYLNNMDNLDNFNLNSPIAQEILKEYIEPERGFDKIGFTRPLGGFFYEFFYAIVVGILVAVTFSTVLKVLYPYPDAKAYTSVGNILFSFLFFIMNIPTAFALEVFVAKYRVKNPGKMIHYIRFYIWYQMLTGILLVTGTSIFVLYILKTGNLVYTKFLLLIYISREYPAMLNVFNATLKGLQRYDYQTKVNYFGQIIQPITEVICVLYGRFVIGANPMFGEIMGIAIGYAIGTYIDDFITMFIAMFYLNKVLKPMGFSVSDTLVPRIELDVIKDSVWFGLKLSPPGFVNSFTGFFTFFWWYDLVPAYATLLVLNETADSIANVIRRGGGIYLKGTMSESLNNGKKKLTEYYVAMALKFSFMTMFAIGVLLYAFMPGITEVMFIAGDLHNWLLAIAFITPNIIESTTEQVYSISRDVILGAGRPGWDSFTSILKTFNQLFLDYLLLFVFQIPQNAPMVVLVWIIALRDLPNKVLGLILNYGYIQIKLFKIHYKSFAWQTWVAPLPAAVLVYLIAELWFKIAFPWLNDSITVYGSAAVTILFGFLALLWIFFPIYTFFGGWDDNGLKIFDDAVEISGPSKFLFRPIVFANKIMKKSKLHGRFAIPYEEANREADELMKERFVKDRLIQIIEQKVTI